MNDNQSGASLSVAALSLDRARACLTDEALWRKASGLEFIRRNAGPRFPASDWCYRSFYDPSFDDPKRILALLQHAGGLFWIKHMEAHYRLHFAFGERHRNRTIGVFGYSEADATRWTEITGEASRRLQVPLDERDEPDFSAGCLSFQRMSFWGVRVFDRLGLPLRRAMIAYGSELNARRLLRLDAIKTALEMNAEVWDPPRSDLAWEFFEAEPFKVMERQCLQELEQELRVALAQETLILTYGTLGGSRKRLMHVPWSNPSLRFDLERSSVTMFGRNYRSALILPGERCSALGSPSKGELSKAEARDRIYALCGKLKGTNKNIDTELVYLETGINRYYYRKFDIGKMLQSLSSEYGFTVQRVGRPAASQTPK